MRGEARNAVMTLNNPDWDTIKAKLLNYFTYLANKEILTSQLENARQEENETLSAFADRVRKLLREKNATYAYMTEEQKLEINRTARKAFSKGLFNRSLKSRLVTRGASSLEDAIAYAIEAENDFITDIPLSELYCRKCNQNGHRLRDCKNTNNNNNSELNRLISALRSFTTQNAQFQMRNTAIQSNSPIRGFPYNPNRNSWNSWNSSMFNRNIGNPPNRNWNSNNFSSNRNWNSNGFSSNRNWNNSMPNRNWDNNNSMPNRNWNNNNSMTNRNWNSNNYSPNQNRDSRNWNQGQNWNRNSNSNDTYNQSQNSNNQGQNRNNFGQQRQNERPRQNNNANVINRSSPTRSSTSENSHSEN